MIGRSGRSEFEEYAPPETPQFVRRITPPETLAFLERIKDLARSGGSDSGLISGGVDLSFLLGYSVLCQ